MDLLFKNQLKPLMIQVNLVDVALVFGLLLKEVVGKLI